MIYSIITMAGIVIYTLGPWPAGSMEKCRVGMFEMKQQNEAVVSEKDLKFWCGQYSARPKLGEKISPPTETK